MEGADSGEGQCILAGSEPEDSLVGLYLKGMKGTNLQSMAQRPLLVEKRADVTRVWFSCDVCGEFTSRGEVNSLCRWIVKDDQLELPGVDEVRGELRICAHDVTQEQLHLHSDEVREETLSTLTRTNLVVGDVVVPRPEETLEGVEVMDTVRTIDTVSTVSKITTTRDIPSRLVLAPSSATFKGIHAASSHEAWDSLVDKSCKCALRKMSIREYIRSQHIRWFTIYQNGCNVRVDVSRNLLYGSRTALVRLCHQGLGKPAAGATKGGVVVSGTNTLWRRLVRPKCMRETKLRLSYIELYAGVMSSDYAQCIAGTSHKNTLMGDSLVITTTEVAPQVRSGDGDCEEVLFRANTHDSWRLRRGTHTPKLVVSR